MEKLTFKERRIKWIQIHCHDNESTGIQKWKSWTDLKKQLVKLAVVGKNCCLITAGPQSWSISHEFDNTRSINYRWGLFTRVLYHVTTITECSEKAINDIVECTDFDLGTLWIILVDGPDISRDSIDNIILEQRKRGLRPPCLFESLIMCETDGEILYWINPQISTASLTSVLGWPLALDGN